MVSAIARQSVHSRRCLEHCPRGAVQYRDALVSVDLDGLTHKQAAARTGISVSGMKSRVQRGRRQLGALLGACCTVDLSREGAIEGFEPRAKSCDCTTS